MLSLKGKTNMSANINRRRRIDPEKAAIKRAEWADMQARKDRSDANRVRREKRQRAKAAKLERERQEQERSNLMTSRDSPVDEAARILIEDFGPRLPGLAAAMAKIGMQVGQTPAERYVAVTQAALAATSDPGPGVYGFGQAAAEAAGDEELARIWGDEADRLTAEAQARGTLPRPRAASSNPWPLSFPGSP